MCGFPGKHKLCKLHIRGMAGFDCNNMGADSFSGQIEVADHVHDFMSDEFVGEPQTVVADDGAVMKDHRIIEASAFGEPRGDELREVTICDESKENNLS